MPVKMLELNGIRRLWKKLPSTISEAAQIVPMMEALIHFSLISVFLFILMRNFLAQLMPGLHFTCLDCGVKVGFKSLFLDFRVKELKFNPFRVGIRAEGLCP